MDSDLAKLYQCTNGTKDINKAVFRNIDKFLEDFYFQLSEMEYQEILRFQKGTSNNIRGGRRYLPYVFTEQGTAMLSSVLKTTTASKVSINIMRAFVAMRKYLASNNHENRISNIETKLIDYDNKFDEVFERLEPKVNNHLFYEGQIYDVYSLLIDILNQAKDKIILIDNYVDKKFLDIVSNVKVKVVLITSNNCNLTRIDIKKYNSEYHNLEIRYSNKFHDRFIIIDDESLYHCGASLKDLGKKCFAINIIEDKEILENLGKKL